MFQKINAWLHLWLGLASGIIVVIVSLTGCILVFEQEFESLTQPWLHAERPGNAAYLPPSKLHQELTRVFPDKEIHSLWYYGHGRTAKVRMDSDSLSDYTHQRRDTIRFFVEIDTRIVCGSFSCDVHSHCIGIAIRALDVETISTQQNIVKTVVGERVRESASFFIELVQHSNTRRFFLGVVQVCVRTSSAVGIEESNRTEFDEW